MSERRYGCWAGDPKGRAEDKTRCVESVWRGFGQHGTQCERKRGHGTNGEYCKQHDPQRLEQKRKERNARWDAQAERDMAKHEIPRLGLELARLVLAMGTFDREKLEAKAREVLDAERRSKS